jgi:hypothetical protein
MAKAKQSATHLWRCRGEMYSSYSFTTSALDGGERSESRPGALYPRGKDPRYPLDMRRSTDYVVLNTKVKLR